MASSQLKIPAATSGKLAQRVSRHEVRLQITLGLEALQCADAMEEDGRLRDARLFELIFRALLHDLPQLRIVKGIKLIQKAAIFFIGSGIVHCHTYILSTLSGENKGGFHCISP